MGSVGGCLGILAAYTLAFLPPAAARVGPWIMAVAMPVLMVSLMTLGALRTGARARALLVPFSLVLLLVAGGFVVALALPPDTAAGPYWLGLPRRAAVIVYGVGLLPLFVLPLAYALTFDRLTLSEHDVRRVRDAARARSEHTRAS